jgi:tRNA (cmo5U34)-methyltransferase
MTDPTDPKSKSDRVFADDSKALSDFRFTGEIATVFDDMVGRSVPFYSEIQRMVCEVAADFAVPGTRLYDLGCSTATTLVALDPVVKPGVEFVGVDNSAPMLAEARRKLDALGTSRKIELVCSDLHEGPVIENASVVCLVLTLQFVRPLYRERVIRRIASGLLDGGCLLLVEKVTSSNTTLNRLFIEYYYNMKRRNGYSDTEISRKREALENVLIPYRSEENQKLLLDSGFTHVEEMFRWYNFSTSIAIK